MTGAAVRLDELARANPEWAPWLSLLRAVRPALDDPAWTADPTVDVDPARRPRLSGAVLTVDARLAERWTRALLGAARLALPAGQRAFDAIALLEAAVADDAARLEASALSVGVEPDRLRAVAPVLAMPLLHGWRRAHPRAEAWERDGGCPTCGAWPTLTEARGLEASRHLRCARCGDDWRTEWLICAYCGERDHRRIGALVLDTTTAAATRKVETCRSCGGYVKTLTVLAPIAAADLVLEDLATVDLDIAALAHGYRRPDTPAARLEARVVPVPPAARRFPWLR